MGSAPCLQDDLVNIPGILFLECDYMAIGLDAVDKLAQPIRYFATYHPIEINAARKRREDAGGNLNYMVISHQPHEGVVDMIVPFEPPSGSSSLLGVLAGIKMGYCRIVLAGCPLTGKNERGASYDSFREGWEKKLGSIKEKTRSMSGWTREILGPPTDEWLAGQDGKING